MVLTCSYLSANLCFMDPFIYISSLGTEMKVMDVTPLLWEYKQMTHTVHTHLFILYSHGCLYSVLE